MRLIAAVLVTCVVACGPEARDDAGPGDPMAGGGGGEQQGDASSPPAPDPGMWSECAQATYRAEGADAALLVLLDRSSSMLQGQKWFAATHAIVNTLDTDVFDSMHVGLYSAPSGGVQAPACLTGGIPIPFEVPCQAPPFPQVQLALAGTEKSTAPQGVRSMIMQWLNSNAPAADAADASPLYMAVQASLTALRQWPVDGKRILLIVTDGSISCTQFSNRPGFPDANGCDHDWEHPNNIVQLVADANAGAEGVETFVVGVPGADTFDPSAANYPPYRMRLALSALAYAGAPSFVPATCTGTAFTQHGADPAQSCHFDMTQGNFSAAALGDTIAKIRGDVLGCTFALPEADIAGGAVDRAKVNVELSAGGQSAALGRRSDPADTCPAGCWDYDDAGQVELIGPACDKLKAAPDGSVNIVVGCSTVIL